MKKCLVALVLAIMGTTAASAQIITGFGSTQTNPLNLGTDLQGAWSGTGSQTATSVTITNAPSNSAGSTNIILSTLTTPKSIVGNTGQLTLTGTLNSATPTTNTFVISLFDSSFNELDYSFNWSSFAGGGSNGAPVTIGLSGSVGTFNGIVSSWELSPAGSASDSSLIGFTFDKLQAGTVPEPSTYVLLGLGMGLLGFSLSRRQKVTARI